METSKSLRRPNNWPDFESLCKKLWGEIWNCPEIKKNGRSGQNQNGVDVCGIPFGEKEYYGIQCKGKDEYTHKQLTKIEITEEIEKAKLFEPPLKKLYFATTAVKDAVIEQFVREKNIESQKAGLFEIHLFSWEDIVDLIDENKQTLDYYLKSQNYKSSKSVVVTFQNGKTEITLTPKFKKTVTKYRLKSDFDFAIPTAFQAIMEIHKKSNPVFHYQSQKTSSKINLSYSKLQIQIHNTGLESIEELKLSFQFKGSEVILKEDNIKNGEGINSLIFKNNSKAFNLILDNDTKSGKITPIRKILVGDDVYTSEDFFIKTLPIQSDIIVKWKLISNNFKDEGELKINVQPQLIYERKFVKVENLNEEKTVEDKEYQDFIEEIKENEK